MNIAATLGMSPMMFAYAAAQAAAPGRLVLYRLGQFNEVLGRAAATVSQALGLQLTRPRQKDADDVLMCIGASEDLAAGRSTFLIEMLETATILNGATERSLVILDEVGRGTSTHDGLAIAQATMEHLLDVVGCRTLFATHFHELADAGDAVKHAALHGDGRLGRAASRRRRRPWVQTSPAAEAWSAASPAARLRSGNQASDASIMLANGAGCRHMLPL